MKDKSKYWLALAALLVIVIVIALFPAKKPKREVKPSRAIKGKIAIVLDDWGYNLNNISRLNQIKEPLTLAILPNLKFSKKIPHDLHQRGFEIILHLPMEPNEKYNLEKNTIRTSMDKKQIEAVISEDLSSLVYAKGVSNHMGSKVTSDMKTMEIIFKELKRKGLYFLDSYVITQSICQELASRIGLRFAKRDVFLDNNNDPEYIKQQLYKLRDAARLRGYAIGIGHDRRNTLQVLKEVLPKLKSEGYKFVFVSELAQ
jgi:polysaccharide deacetylase 2 family uncharacterized protein YibQ